MLSENDNDNDLAGGQRRMGMDGVGAGCCGEDIEKGCMDLDAID